MDFLTDLESCIPSLRRYARALLRDGERADDLVQDCLERALSRRHLWRGGPTLRPWLFRIMHNLHANQARAWSTRPRHDPIEEAALPPIDESQTAHLALGEMAKALGSLPQEQARVVLLVALEGLSYQEVAEILDVPVGTVMSRLSRARERLRALLSADGTVLRRVK
ncbi:MAG TPA: RNA polymerase sigma factor [Geminicoccaceae bacterium]|nr:RNA polymerase sigma factor [Geminicoccus sp.]HMU49726.1 RNA polymerase sigma factor [Geminicoccaceae bacterium]